MKRATLAAAAVVTGGAMFLIGALGPLRATRSPAEPAAVTSADAVLVPMKGDLRQITQALEERVGSAPDARSAAQLGLAYLQRARDEADPRFLPQADEALQLSLDLQADDNYEATLGMAALGNARHDFSGSVEWSRRAIAIDPADASAYGLLGDALFELGRVGAADAAYQEMVDRRPDVASYVRASYALQYHGRTEAAIAAMEQAVQAAGPAGETAAWVRHQLGDIYASKRDNAEAARQNRIGMALAPGYVPPTVGLAEALISRGRLDEAVSLMEAATRDLPSLEYLITLGDLYAGTGRASDADRQYAMVADKLASYRDNGVQVDADFTVFYADHGLRLGTALREARAGYELRRTPKMADALAWILHANGENLAAWRYAREGISTPVVGSTELFHAGVIAAELGRDGVARRLVTKALDLDPRFSVVQAPEARRLLSRLR